MSNPCTDIDNTSFKFNCVTDSDGAQIIAALYSLDKHGQLSTDTPNSVISSIVSYGYSTATTTCKQSFLADEEISINCDNAVIGDLVANNSNCTLCKSMVNTAIANREALEQEAKTKNGKYTVQNVSADVALEVEGNLATGNDGACKYVCMQCIVDNVNQDIQMNIVDECATNTTEFLDAFTTGMSYQAEVELTKHTSALKTTGYEIANKSDVKDMSIQIANTIKEMTKITTLSELHSSAVLIQQTTIDPGSTSIVINNLSQRISIDMFATLVSKIYSDESVQNAIDYKTKQELITVETNFKDLIDTVSTTVDTLDKLLTDLVGKLIITVIALLLIALIIVAAFLKFHPNFDFQSKYRSTQNLVRRDLKTNPRL